MPKFKISILKGEKLELQPGIYDTPREAAGQATDEQTFMLHELFTHKDFRNVKHNGSGSVQENDNQGKKAAKNKQAVDLAPGTKKGRSDGKKEPGEKKAGEKAASEKSNQETGSTSQGGAEGGA